MRGRGVDKVGRIGGVLYGHEQPFRSVGIFRDGSAQLFYGIDKDIEFIVLCRRHPVGHRLCADMESLVYYSLVAFSGNLEFPPCTHQCGMLVAG